PAAAAAVHRLTAATPWREVPQQSTYQQTASSTSLNLESERYLATQIIPRTGERYRPAADLYNQALRQKDMHREKNTIERRNVHLIAISKWWRSAKSFA